MLKALVVENRMCTEGVMGESTLCANKNQCHLQNAVSTFLEVSSHGVTLQELNQTLPSHFGDQD